MLVLHFFSLFVECHTEKSTTEDHHDIDRACVLFSDHLSGPDEVLGEVPGSQVLEAVVHELNKLSTISVRLEDHGAGLSVERIPAKNLGVTKIK